jgi:hypothetical protein
VDRDDEFGDPVELGLVSMADDDADDGFPDDDVVDFVVI